VKREVGLWIDRHKAVIVTIVYDGSGVKSTQSRLDKRVRFSGVLSQDGWVGNLRDRRFVDHLAGYYDDVISCILGADSIQIFGPGEAKLQLANRLRHEALGGRIVGVETMAKMTERQIEAKVWQHLLSS